MRSRRPSSSPSARPGSAAVAEATGSILRSRVWWLTCARRKRQHFAHRARTGWEWRNEHAHDPDACGAGGVDPLRRRRVFACRRRGRAGDRDGRQRQEGLPAGRRRDHGLDRRDDRRPGVQHQPVLHRREHRQPDRHVARAGRRDDRHPLVGVPLLRFPAPRDRTRPGREANARVHDQQRGPGAGDAAVPLPHRRRTRQLPDDQGQAPVGGLGRVRQPAGRRHRQRDGAHLGRRAGGRGRRHRVPVQRPQLGAYDDRARREFQRLGTDDRDARGGARRSSAALRVARLLRQRQRRRLHVRLRRRPGAGLGARCPGGDRGESGEPARVPPGGRDELGLRARLLLGQGGRGRLRRGAGTPPAGAARARRDRLLRRRRQGSLAARDRRRVLGLRRAARTDRRRLPRRLGAAVRRGRRPVVEPRRRHDDARDRPVAQRQVGLHRAVGRGRTERRRRPRDRARRQARVELE